MKTVGTNLNLEELADFQDYFLYLMGSQQHHDISFYISEGYLW